MPQAMNDEELQALLTAMRENTADLRRIKVKILKLKHCAIDFGPNGEVEEGDNVRHHQNVMRLKGLA